MQLVFKIRNSETSTVTAHSELKDVIELGMTPEHFLTGEQLSEEFRMTKELTLQILDSSKVRPIAKIVNRARAIDGSPNGPIKGGRPRLAFNPQEARAALAQSIENKYIVKD